MEVREEEAEVAERFKEGVDFGVLGEEVWLRVVGDIFASAMRIEE